MATAIAAAVAYGNTSLFWFMGAPRASQLWERLSNYGLEGVAHQGQSAKQ